jgi:hypothetical protein
MNNTKTTDNATTTKDDGFAMIPEAYCSNTLHLTNASFGFCEDDVVLCSSDPRVASSCCKCKPDCCDQCSSRSSAWDSEYPIVCPTDTERDNSILVSSLVAAALLLFGIYVLLKSSRLQKHARIHPQNRELPNELQHQARKEQLASDKARQEQIPSKFHICTIQTIDRVRSLIEHKESSKKAFNAEKKEGVMEDVSLDDDANTNTSSNTGSSGIDVEKGRQTSQVTNTESTSTLLLLSFWRKQDVENTECPICLERYKPGDTICVSKVAECDHIFHQECVSAWISKHDDCPLCRIDLMSETR